MYNWKFNIGLNHVELQNFRGVEELRLAFDPKLTVLIGENGSGKTTVLDALASLLQVFVDKTTSRETGKIETQYITTNDIRNGTVEATNSLSMFFDFEGSAVKEESKKANQLEFENKVYEGILEWSVTLNESGYEAEDTSKTVDFTQLSKIIRLINLNYKSNLQEQEKSKHVPLSVPLVIYYCPLKATTAITSTNERLRTDIMSAYEDALAYNSFDFTKFFRWFKWQENIKTQLGENPLLDAVANAIYQMLNNEEAVFSNLKTDWINNPDGELLINKENDENPLKISQFSSGEKSILALTADLARRLAIANPYAENPLHGNGIVLIDEIDLHLHPRWQRAILPKLMAIFPNIQWVVTTHSPQILGEVKEGSIYILENAKVELLKFNTYGKDMNRILERIMGVAERNEAVEQLFDEYFELIEKNELETAAKKRNELEKLVGKDEPLFSRADGIIRRKQLIGR